MADIDLETRSTDGSDSEGSLCDFVTKDDDDNDIVSSGEEEDEPERDESAVLREEFPYDKSLLEDTRVPGKPRRSRRTRKQATRYMDPDYAKLMYDDVEVDKLSSSDDETNKSGAEDDDVFVIDDFTDESDDGSGTEVEDTEDKATEVEDTEDKATGVEDTEDKATGVEDTEDKATGVEDTEKTVVEMVDELPTAEKIQLLTSDYCATTTTDPAKKKRKIQKA